MSDTAFKNFSRVAIARIITAVSLAIFYLVFATILEPDKYGELGYLFALAGTFSVLSRLGLQNSLVVYLAKGEKLLANQLNLFVVITTSVASILLLFINEYAAILCLATSFFVLYQFNLLGKKKYDDFMKKTILRNVLTITLPFPLYFVLDIQGIILGMAIGNIFSSIWLVKSISLRVKSFQVLKSNYRVLLNNFGADISADFRVFIDRIVVGTFFGFVFLGLYHFNMQLLYALEMIPNILYLFLLSEESSGEKHTKISFFVVALSGLICVIVIIFAPFVIEQFFPHFIDGILSLQILVISIIPLSISSIILAKLQAKKSITVGYTAIIKIGVLLPLLILLGNENGLIGVSFAVVISSIADTLFLFFLYHHQKSPVKS